MGTTIGSQLQKACLSGKLDSFMFKHKING
uniref:Uncharacterized protein n=1 Tax=Anguilla anguilla TaxID=7936 RepID=A0A0E9QC08_ANGAN